MRMSRNSLFAAGFTAMAAVALPVAVQANTPPAAGAAQTPGTDPSVMVFNQKIQNGQLHVDYAYLPSNGYVVVYGSGSDGKVERSPIGHQEMNAGSHLNFKVKLDKQPAEGASLWVSIYEDKGAKAGFDKQTDASVWGDKIPSQNQVVVQ